MDLPPSMYVNYISRRKSDHARLAEALASSQGLEDFKVVGHQIKGNATSFGFDDLVAIGEKMEKLDSSRLLSEGPGLLEDFWKWIVAAEQRLERELPDEFSKEKENV